MNKMSKGAKVGTQIANSFIEIAHLMYNKKTAIRVIQAVISELNARLSEFN